MDNHVKAKKYHNSTQNCQFSIILDQNDRNFMGIHFQRSTGKSAFIIDEFCRFLKFLIKKCFFSTVKNPKKSWRPNRVPPHPGRGTIWYHMVPYGTIWFSIVPLFLFLFFPFFQICQFVNFLKFSIFQCSIFPSFSKLFTISYTGFL